MNKAKIAFGKDKVNNLLNILQRYINAGYAQDRTQFQSALNVLEKYYELNSHSNDIEVRLLEERYINLIKTVSVRKVEIKGGGTIVEKSDLLKGGKGNFQELAFSRHSIRNFSTESVDIDRIKNAIRIAQQSPSACNRQSARTYIIKEKERVEQILSIHQGNRGFGHLIQCILIVTSDLNVFRGANERNSNFIDGGLFAMSLLYALHYEGIGACPLNWAVLKENDIKLRNCVGINDSENVILIIGVGIIPDELKVASSQRKSVEEITIVI
ncbi:nitroreductase family protein [Cohnella sp. 56]|uniref:nitroreductase family protein n=1 Tax=Cohnella sp. 56 TaxID=3113722 RepID=UPI0030EAA57B